MSGLFSYVLIKGEPQVLQKNFVTFSDDLYEDKFSEPFSHLNWFLLIDARVLKAEPCQRLHFEQ